MYSVYPTSWSKIESYSSYWILATKDEITAMKIRCAWPHIAWDVRVLLEWFTSRIWIRLFMMLTESILSHFRRWKDTEQSKKTHANYTTCQVIIRSNKTIIEAVGNVPPALWEFLCSEINTLNCFTVKKNCVLDLVLKSHEHIKTRCLSNFFFY